MTRATLSRRVGVPVLDVDTPALGDDPSAQGGAARAVQALLGTPRRWAGRTQFTCLETDFGVGHGFLAWWRAWLDDSQRPDRLHVVALSACAPTRRALLRAHARSANEPLLAQLVAAWPPATANLHALSFEGGRVRLLLGLGHPGELLRDLDARFDACRLAAGIDWAHDVKTLARLAAPGALLAASARLRGEAADTSDTIDISDTRDTHPTRGSSDETARRALRSAGFTLAETGSDLLATYAPDFVPRERRARRPLASKPGRVLIVGAGLAGAAVAAALAELGWRSTVLDRAATPADGASGNPAGLFHGALHGDDAVHARFNRAAALLAARTFAPLIASGAVAGQVEGLLRVAQEDIQALSALAAHQHVPASYAQALAPVQADALSACPLGRAAWLYTQGGWVDPGACVRHWLTHERVTWKGGAAVTALQRSGTGWLAVSADGTCLAEGDAVVVAAAQGSTDLLRAHADTSWPLTLVRGQVSWWEQTPADAPRPALPLSGAGYAIALRAGGLLFGATTQVGDTDPAPRSADHGENLSRLEALTAWNGSAAAATLQGRVAWRCVTRDRLPVAGPVVHQRSDGDAPVPVPGLYVATALGSRGVTWAPLIAACIAAQIAGAPLPLERGLAAAIAPARWLRRRRGR